MRLQNDLNIHSLYRPSESLLNDLSILFKLHSYSKIICFTLIACLFHYLLQSITL